MWDIALSKGVTKKFFRKPKSPVNIVLFRLGIVIALILIVATIFYLFEVFGAGHIEDTSDNDFTFIDSLYFTVVTVTTVGYGDIIPVSEEARMFDVLIITPVRMVVWVMFIGTAYQLVIHNYWERYNMNIILKNMKDHAIVAGYGTTGAAAVSELFLKDYNENNLIVIDIKESAVQRAAEAGTTAILGDAASEEILNNAVIGTARVLIVASHQDDTNVLITLTAKDLNPKVKVIARVSQQENIKQLKRAGADVIISPSLTSGNLMAMAVSTKHSVELIEDLLTTSRGAKLLQRKVKDSEVKKSTKQLKECVVLGVVRKGKSYGPKELDGIKLQKDDEIIYIG
jgi:voltage-gated potassium channel